jgi:hypothetical protein
MERKPKRIVTITLSRLTKSNLYPDGRVYELVLEKIGRSEKVSTLRVSTDTLDTALDYAESFLDTGVVSGYPQA